MKITGNEPAFSEIRQPKNSDEDQWSGLTIRQQFAMAAMQGLLASAETWKSGIDPEKYANTSVILADALIAELNKEEQ